VRSRVEGPSPDVSFNPPDVTVEHFSRFLPTESDVSGDVLHKNENKRVDMIDITLETQTYLGQGFKHRVLSG